MTTGRAATVLVLGAVNAFTRCVRARRAVKPAGAQARARNVVVDACIVAFNCDGRESAAEPDGTFRPLSSFSLRRPASRLLHLVPRQRDNSDRRH